MSVIARVNPELLVWARETAGFSLEDASIYLDVTPDELEAVERGAEFLTVSKLRNLSKKYKRPLAAFYLPSPPKEKILPQDFRTFPEGRERPISPKTYILIRKIRQLREDANELANELSVAKKPLHVLSLSDKPEAAAAKIRKDSGISVDMQLKWASDSQAFDEWRTYLEDKNIFVFQQPLPLSEVRGFTLYGDGFPAIAVSSKEVAATAKNFTLFHEYAHILIGREGMCLPQYEDESRSERGEIFCNHFAGAFLVPQQPLLDLARSYSDLDEIRHLARKFKVSKYVILRRFQILRAITKSKYIELYNDMLKNEQTAKGFGRSTPATKCVSRYGRKYLTLLLNAVSKNMMSHGELVRRLRIGPKYVREVAGLVLR